MLSALILMALTYGAENMLTQPIVILPHTDNITPSLEGHTVDLIVPIVEAFIEDRGENEWVPHVEPTIPFTRLSPILVDEDPHSKTVGAPALSHIRIRVRTEDAGKVSHAVDAATLDPVDRAMLDVYEPTREMIRERTEPVADRSEKFRAHMAVATATMTKADQAALLDRLNVTRQLDDDLTRRVAEDMDIADIEITPR